MRILVDKLNASQQCALAAKATNSTSGWVKQSMREGILHLCSALMRHCWTAGSSPGLTTTRDLDMLEQVQWTKMIKELEQEVRLRELGLLSLKQRRLKGLLSVHINTWWGKARRQRLFSVVPNAQGNRKNWNTINSIQNRKDNFHCKGGQTQRLWSLPSVEIFKPTEHCPEQHVPGNSALSRALD